MKKLPFLLLLASIFIACNDEKRKSDPVDGVQYENSTPADTSNADTPDAEVIDEAATEKDGVQTEPDGEEPEVQEQQSSATLAGKYIQIDPDEPGSCNCNCIEVSFTTPTELCIALDEIYITARYAKVGNTKANIFLNEVTRAEAAEGELPWEDFDKNTPIATLTRQPDGSVKLDWLGFAIDGEIAVDYAIYGKKALEGQYKKY